MSKKKIITTLILSIVFILVVITLSMVRSRDNSDQAIDKAYQAISLPASLILQKKDLTRPEFSSQWQYVYQTTTDADQTRSDLKRLFMASNFTIANEGIRGFTAESSNSNLFLTIFVTSGAPTNVNITAKRLHE